MLQNLITAAELSNRLGDSQTIIFDVRFSLSDIQYGSRQYALGHIPGAHYLHLDHDLSRPIAAGTGRHPLPLVAAFVECMQRHGVSAGTQVVAYDDASGMFAARLWWLLKWLGHDRVAVLDGGLPAWTRSGGAVETTTPAEPLRGSFQAHVRSDMLLEVEALQSALAQGQVLLCDARAPERYRGEVEPIDKVAGHVPGAVNLPFSRNLDAQGCFKSAAELSQLHAQVDDARPIVHMCGSGVTACHNVLAATVGGHPLPRLYAGSWSEWITDPSRPIARGDD